jgi:hypothetical protein
MKEINQYLGLQVFYVRVISHLDEVGLCKLDASLNSLSHCCTVQCYLIEKD